MQKSLKKYIYSFQVYSLDFFQFVLGKKNYYCKNYEKISDFYLDRYFYKNRKHGLSAMMRLKNDERWIFFAIQSVIEDVDEIIVILQNCTDNTEVILKSFNSEKIKIYHYPFNCFPAGSKHKNYLKNSIFNLAYYYNFALNKTNFSYVWKWDGDHSAYEDRLKEIREIVDSEEYDIIHFKGYDIYGADLKYLCKNPYTSNEPWIFKVSKKTFYISGSKCEEFSYPLLNGIRKVKVFNYLKPLFIHFKYVNSFENIGKGWIENWKEDPAFKKVIESKTKGEEFTDEYPRIIRDYYFKS